MFGAIHTFGCLFFAHNQITHGDKFANRSRKCVFMGYPFGKKGWRLYDLESKVFLCLGMSNLLRMCSLFVTPLNFLPSFTVLVSLRGRFGCYTFATPEDVHIESHGFELPYDIHDDFVEYEE